MVVVLGKPEASSCDVDQFHCSNGKCIPDWWRCNSMDECGDNSDEELCVDSPFSFQPCNLNQFPCLSRYTRIYTCLPHSLRCDGSIDCQVKGCSGFYPILWNTFNLVHQNFPFKCFFRTLVTRLTVTFPRVENGWGTSMVPSALQTTLIFTLQEVTARGWLTPGTTER